jgi:hypothetical protein
MNEHLPECPVAAACPGTFTFCICGRLRAAEMRGVDAQLSIDLDVAREDVWNEAITAAREAVAALLAYESPYGPLIRTMAALAAIDALREEKE